MDNSNFINYYMIKLIDEMDKNYERLLSWFMDELNCTSRRCAEYYMNKYFNLEVVQKNEGLYLTLKSKDISEILDEDIDLICLNEISKR